MITIEELLKTQTEHLSIQLFRYTIVGGVAYIVDFGSLFFFTEWMHFHYLVSAALAFLLGLITNYYMSVSWVFGRRTSKNKFYEFIVFSVIGVVGLLLNELFMWYFTEHVGFHYMVSKVAATIFIFAWNFVARKLTLFN
jgi:putative flippase GtrA